MNNNQERSKREENDAVEKKSWEDNNSALVTVARSAKFHFGFKKSQNIFKKKKSPLQIFSGEFATQKWFYLTKTF